MLCLAIQGTDECVPACCWSVPARYAEDEVWAKPDCGSLSPNSREGSPSLGWPRRKQGEGQAAGGVLAEVTCSLISRHFLVFLVHPQQGSDVLESWLPSIDSRHP